jgi:hypothetical protein
MSFFRWSSVSHFFDRSVGLEPKKSSERARFARATHLTTKKFIGPVLPLNNYDFEL